MSVQTVDFPLVSHPLLTAWHWVMRQIVFRGAPRISSWLCRWLLPKRCAVRAARGYLMAIHAQDYSEACALCDCLSRHLTNFVHNFLQPGDVFIDGGGGILGSLHSWLLQRLGLRGECWFTNLTRSLSPDLSCRAG